MRRARVRAHNARIKYALGKQAGKRQSATASGLRYANLAFDRAQKQALCAVVGRCANAGCGGCENTQFCAKTAYKVADFCNICDKLHLKP